MIINQYLNQRCIIFIRQINQDFTHSCNSCWLLWRFLFLLRMCWFCLHIVSCVGIGFAKSIKYINGILATRLFLLWVVHTVSLFQHCFYRTVCSNLIWSKAAGLSTFQTSASALNLNLIQGVKTLAHKDTCTTMQIFCIIGLCSCRVACLDRLPGSAESTSFP